MPPYDYDYLIGAARGGDQRAKLLLDYLAANKRVNSFINSGSYQYSPVIEDVTVGDDVNDVDIDSGNVDDIYKDIRKDIDGQGSRNDWMSNALTIMNGATGIINTSKGMMQTGNTSQQNGMIQDIGNIGNQKFGNYGQAISAYDQINALQPDISFNTYRGSSTKERVGGVLSNTITGATTGAQVGGLYGGIAGGIIGFGAGVGSWLGGDYAARANMANDENRLYLARARAGANTQAGIEDLQSDDHDNKVYNLGAKGGKMQRGHTPIKAEKVKGGTKIRIKR